MMMLDKGNERENGERGRGMSEQSGLSLNAGSKEHQMAEPADSLRGH